MLTIPHVSVEQKPQDVSYLMHWGTMAEHPETTGADPAGEEIWQLGDYALRQFFFVQDRERTLRGMLFGRAALLEAGAEASGSTPQPLYDVTQSWYRSLGPTNALHAAQPMLEYAAEALERAAKTQDKPAAEEFVLAADLYHEAALQARGKEEFDSLCNDAKRCYEQVVHDDAEGQSRVSLLANADPRTLRAGELRSIVRATGRYHDLQFLQMRPDGQRVLDGYGLPEPLSDVYLEVLRARQYRALSDFRATLDIAARRGADGKPLLPGGLLHDQFVVLAARNELLQHPKEAVLLRLLETSVRNAFPREAAPVGRNPKGLDPFKANVVVEKYSRVGEPTDKEYYQTDAGQEGWLANGVYRLPWAENPAGKGRSPRLPVPTMLRWTNLMRDLADVSQTNSGVRARIYEKMVRQPLPFRVDSLLV